MSEHYSVIVGLSLALVVTSLLVVEVRHLKYAALAYFVQGLLLVAILVGYATLLPNHALYLWSVTVLISKAGIIPLLLWHYLKRMAPMETPNALGFGISLVIGVAVLAGFYWLVDGHMTWLAPVPQLAGEPYGTNLSVAFTILAFGLYALLSRRDTLKAVMGVCLIENAVHLSLVSLAPGLPETAMIGVVTDVVLSVWILLIIIKGMYEQVGSSDIREMAKLWG
ncbi:Hydrogenase-4 component E [Pelotomaculum schinkii]|uniref:Hydrogenase-4 component E n=1 Tax=Pelotomaculum schinkii TaxID=78350 RepID=A0A4Y7RH04_9FIRM|nr:NADH-quinone oxidoreductase subunit K [Pelotomaculum schinkii]TEB08096.1 Hydrogenase-4 component E [Pelotomaculum schinkii]